MQSYNENPVCQKNGDFKYGPDFQHCPLLALSAA